MIRLEKESSLFFKRKNERSLRIRHLCWNLNKIHQNLDKDFLLLQWRCVL